MISVISVSCYAKYPYAESFCQVLFWQLGNWDIDVFIFRHRFQIMRLKFLKFSRDQNGAENFQIGINES